MRVDGYDIEVTHDFRLNCLIYCAYVGRLRERGYRVQLETRVTPNAIFFPDPAPIDLFGTADIIAWDEATRHLEIVDLKFGRGVSVEVEDNEQFLYYALGVLLTTGYPAEKITLTVVQPRAEHEDGPVRSQDWLALDVLMWGQDTLKAGVLLALSEDAPLKTGSHCRWCPVLGTCPQAHEDALKTAKQVFSAAPLSPPVPANLLDYELADIVAKLDVIDAWGQAVRQEAYNRLVQGQEVPGYKLVQKRASRKYSDDHFAVGFLGEALGDDAFTRKPKTPAAIEKLAGGKAVLRDMEAMGYLTKASTGTTMVPVTDPRPAVAGRTPVDVAFEPVHDFLMLPGPKT